MVMVTTYTHPYNDKHKALPLNCCRPEAFLLLYLLMLNLMQALLKMLPAAKKLRCIITPILQSVFLPVCVFVSFVIVIFVSVKRRSDSHGAQRREKKEKRRTGKEESKNEQAQITKVVWW